jgi:hypothetical protein
MDLKKINYLYFDMYSKRASFFYNNQEKIGSYFGLFLTILYILCLLLLFFYNLILTVKRKEIKVYDSSIYAQKMPSITINSDNLYFAFGVEHPKTNLRFIDETIYYPQILFIDRVKQNGEFKTITKKVLDVERCKEENFGKNYQHLFIKGELNSSYCLKDFNYNLTLAGGYKYEQMSYIRIKLFQCTNTSENNNHCKSQEEIDQYLTNGYFSILVKNFGLNPSNYSFPVLPTLQDLYTTIDKRLYRNFVINFGITEIHTDNGLINQNINIQKYLQYRQTIDSFSFANEDGIKNGKEFCIAQLRLDDNIFIQKRAYTKISEICSRIGGYMQLLYAAFSLISIFINKITNEVKIINSIFKFNIKKKRMILRFNNLKELESSNVLIMPLRKSITKIKGFEFVNKSKLNLIKEVNNETNICNSDNKNMKNTQSSNMNSNNENFVEKININNNIKNIKNNNKLNLYAIKKEESIKQFNEEFSINNNLKITNDIMKDYNDQININFIQYFCCKKDRKKKKQIDSFNLGIEFYRKKMDLIHYFTILLIIEKIIAKNKDI